MANMGKVLNLGEGLELLWGQQQMMLLEIVEIEEEGERGKVR